MADKINTIQSIKLRQADGWDTAIQQLTQEHPVVIVENLVSVNEVLLRYPTRQGIHHPLPTASYPQHDLEIYDKSKKLLHVCHDLQLIDGKLYVREPYLSNTSWFNWLFSRFYSVRSPTVNVNVRRR